MPKRTEFDLSRLFEEPDVVIAEMVFIDLMDLERCMVGHARLYGHIAGLCENAKAEAAAAKYDLEFVASQVFRELSSEGTVRIAVSRTEIAVKETLRYQNQLKKLQAKDKVFSVLKRCLEALEHRRDMIIQIAARQRQEIASYKD